MNLEDQIRELQQQQRATESRLARLEEQLVLSQKMFTQQQEIITSFLSQRESLRVSSEHDTISQHLGPGFEFHAQEMHDIGRLSSINLYNSNMITEPPASPSTTQIVSECKENLPQMMDAVIIPQFMASFAQRKFFNVLNANDLAVLAASNGQPHQTLSPHLQRFSKMGLTVRKIDGGSVVYVKEKNSLKELADIKDMPYILYWYWSGKRGCKGVKGLYSTVQHRYFNVSRSMVEWFVREVGANK